MTDQWWMTEGAVVGAMVCYANTVHAGVVHPIPEMRAYSMTPLCGRYRKANGDRPAAYERGETPHLDRNFERPFAVYRGELRPLHGRKLCRWCVSVWDADCAEQAALVRVPDDLAGIRST